MQQIDLFVCCIGINHLSFHPVPSWRVVCEERQAVTKGIYHLRGFSGNHQVVIAGSCGGLAHTCMGGLAGASLGLVQDSKIFIAW